MLKKLKGWIFDLDGTLVDSNLNFDKMRQEIGIKDNTPVLEYLEALKDPQKIQEGLQIIDKHELEGASNARWIEGAKELLELLQSRAIPMAILTRNSKKVTQLTIEKLSIPISHYITRDDCLPKPHPEGLLKVSCDWKMNTRDIAYVGDFHFDLQTAQAANMPFLFYCPKEDNIPSFAKSADCVFHHYHELYKKIV